MQFYRISELTKDHQGKVALVNVSELAHGKGLVCRQWAADEGPSTRGTDDPAALQMFFSHFLLLSEIEEAELADHVGRYGPLTTSEREHFDRKYGRRSDTSTCSGEKNG